MIQKNYWLVALALFALAGCGDSKTGAQSESKSTDSRKAKLAELEAKETEIFTKFLLDAVKNDLKDPDSAQVRNVVHYGGTIFFKEGNHAKLGVHTICGEINARNSFGGYVGYRLFNAKLVWDSDKNELRDGTLYKIIDKDESGPMHELFMENYSKFCKETEVKE